MSLMIQSNIDARATVFEINVSEPPDWDAIEIGSNVTTLTISTNFQGFYPNDAPAYDIISLAFLIQSHRHISTFNFKFLEETHLGYVCVATNGQRDKPLTLKFFDCTIDRFGSSALSGMLRAGLIESLSFIRCPFYETGVIEFGLEHNTGLQKFEYVPYLRRGGSLTTLDTGVLGMLNCSTSITHLQISMKNQDIYQLCDVIRRNSTIQNLEISDATFFFDLDSATAIAGMMERVDNKALKELNLKSCIVDKSGLALLLQTFSGRELLQSLTFEKMKFRLYVDSQGLSWANLKVKSLSLSGILFELDDLNIVINAIANNPYIQNLNLSGVLHDEEEFQLLCDAFFEPNRGPSRLFIDHLGSHGALISDALQQNTSLKVLTVGGLELDGLEAFAEELANMGGLRELYFGTEDEPQIYSKTFFENLTRSLEENPTLHTLGIRSINSDVELAKPFLPWIKYLLAFNRVGRNSLLETDVPLGIWAPAFARILDQADLVYYFVKNKPEVAGNEQRT
jgi:hypothetical protein